MVVKTEGPGDCRLSAVCEGLSALTLAAQACRADLWPDRDCVGSRCFAERTCQKNERFSGDPIRHVTAGMFPL